MGTKPECYRCGATEKKLRECKQCKTIFCADCIAPRTDPNFPNVQKIIITGCPECGSGDIIFQEDDPSSFK